jgi:hypothetical protein
MSPAEVARSSFPSVVLIVTKDESGQPLGLGSGFVVKRGLVATNLHVLEGASSAFTKPINASSSLPVEAIVSVDSLHDLALLGVPAANENPLPLGGDQLPEVGSRVYAIGNPGGLEGTFSDGIISGVRALPSGQLLQITAPISPGSSGGPVLDSRGKVIGVAFATFRGGQNLNFAIPAKYLTALLNQSAHSLPLPLPQSRAGSGQLLRDLAGEPPTSAVEAKDFRWRYEYPGIGTGAEFFFFLVNRLRISVKEVGGLVIFYDDSGQPLDFLKFQYSDPIPGGLAKMVDCCREGRYGSSRLTVDSEIRERTTYSHTSGYQQVFDLKPHSKVEIRILTFETASADE